VLRETAGTFRKIMDYQPGLCIHLGLFAEKLLEVLQGFAVILYHICSRS